MRILALFFAACFCAPSDASERVDRAKQVFTEYVSKWHAFDPSVADLYSDSALIQNTRTYPDGQVRQIVIPAAQYKQIVRGVMPLARSRNDRSEYRSPTFSEEATGVRIKIIRYSALKNYTSPMSLLVGPDESGLWLVLEEIISSIP